MEGTPAEDENERSVEEKPKQEDYKFAKYNIEVRVPSYDEELYDAELKDDDWSKAETDYLVSLVRDFAQKWPIIVDRYDFPASGDADPKPRSMEDLKARYYAVSAKILARETPVAGMNGQQYSLFQTLTNFNPVQETSRKKLAEIHLYRTQSEVDEETFLLSELQRIVINQQSLEADRKELRDRLDYPVASNNTTSTQYSTSQALGALFQQLLAADRMKKDRRIKEHANATPSNINVGQNAQHRDSITNATSAQVKRPARESMASATDVARALSPHSNQRYFVTMHDRISAGVSFASDKLSKPRIAKSTVQTERIASVLQYLKIPDLIPLPTQRVVEEFDKMMSKVQSLLDLRKISEREEEAIKVKRAEDKMKSEKGGAASVETSKDGEAASANADDQMQNGDPTGDASSDVQSKRNKRSASVLSQGSQQSNKRPKSRHG